MDLVFQDPSKIVHKWGLFRCVRVQEFFSIRAIKHILALVSSHHGFLKAAHSKGSAFFHALQ